MLILVPMVVLRALTHPGLLEEAVVGTPPAHGVTPMLIWVSYGTSSNSAPSLPLKTGPSITTIWTVFIFIFNLPTRTTIIPTTDVCHPLGEATSIVSDTREEVVVVALCLIPPVTK